MKRDARRHRGAALVEFAIVLPVFLMMVLGAIDWGWFFLVQDVVSNAAREGARASVVGVSGDGATRATSLIASMLPPTQAARCTASETAVSVGTAPGVQVACTCLVGSLSGVTRIPPFTWVMPPQATAAVIMRR